MSDNDGPNTPPSLRGWDGRWVRGIILAVIALALFALWWNTGVGVRFLP